MMIDLFTETKQEEDFGVMKQIDINVGDVFILGEHRLMCGDSTNTEHIKKLMNGKIADLVFTDPPYGMKKESDGMMNDNLNYDDLLEFNKMWIPLSFKHLKDNGSWYCWGIDEPLMDIYSHILKPMIKRNELTFRNLLTWNKGNGQGQLSELFRSYAIADEKCLFVMCGVQGFNNNQDNYFDKWDAVRLYLVEEAEKVGLTPAELTKITGVGMYSHWFTKSQWTMIPEHHYKKIQEYYNKREYDVFKREYDELKREYDELKREFYNTRSYFNNTHDNINNVWHFNRSLPEEVREAGGHPTPKPIPLVSRAIKSSSRKGELVLDLFAGGGSTMVASHYLKRISYLMELNPYYCNVIINRYEKITGKKAIKE